MASSTQNRSAVLLIAHGSRRAEANEDLPRLAEAVRRRGAYAIVEIAYLELAEPTIPQGAQACATQGAKRVLMLPYFLSAGSHVVEDLEQYRRELSERFASVSFQVCRPLGLHPLMFEIVADRLREADEATEGERPA
jgi:sirohydrochlorin ferrochelatase